MEYRLRNLISRVLEAWSNASLYDYAFAAAWIILIGYLVSKTSQVTTKY